MKKFQSVVKLIQDAQKLAKEQGIRNILQPGLVKEIIIADILGHEVLIDKHKPDACDPQNPARQFEYLSAYDENKVFGIDSLIRTPAAKREKSLARITRNHRIYFAMFDHQDPLSVLEIWEVLPNVLLKETERQMAASCHDKVHANYSYKWATENGILVYSSQGG